MRVYAGTSGFSYKEWKGSFYPAKLKNDAMLAFYGERFRTVEINNTFYRMPKAEVLEKWAADVPDDFAFVLKASKYISHKQRLAESAESVAYLFDRAATLGAKLGPVLVQVPPFMRKDRDRLAAFLDTIPEGRRVAFELRHASWADEDVFDLLRARDQAWVVVDAEEEAKEGSETPRVLAPLASSASWGYLRLRRCDYTPEEMDVFAARIAEQGWSDVFAFFKHEDDGTGPVMAEHFLAAAARAGLTSASTASPAP